MPKPNSLLRTLRLLPAVLFLAVALHAPAQAADLPLATASPLAGFSFDDKPLSLPVQENFQMALLTAGSELGRSCGKTEAYGWRMAQSEQGRVDQIFNNTVDRLRALGYVVEAQTPSSVSHDVTLFTADTQSKHFIFMWSAGEIGLVMVLCESTPPLMNRNGTASYASPAPLGKNVPPVPEDVVASTLNIPVQDKASLEAAKRFTPIGTWVGNYTCSDKYTGGTLKIDSLSGRNFNGVFRFYPTPKNPHMASGSYNVFGQYDKTTHRMLINPGKWIYRPAGYYNTIMVGRFDPVTRSFSAYFQDIAGCTSFEAKSGKEPSYKLPVSKKDKSAKTKTVKKQKTAAKKPAKPSKHDADIVAKPSANDKAQTPPPSPGITPESATPTPPVPPVPAPPAPAAPPEPAANSTPPAQPAPPAPAPPAPAVPSMPPSPPPASLQPVPPLPSQVQHPERSSTAPQPPLPDQSGGNAQPAPIVPTLQPEKGGVQ